MRLKNPDIISLDIIDTEGKYKIIIVGGPEPRIADLEIVVDQVRVNVNLTRNSNYLDYAARAILFTPKGFVVPDDITEVLSDFLRLMWSSEEVDYGPKYDVDLVVWENKK